MISVVILTKNSKDTIEKCLKSVKDFDDIVVIDDYSEDETIRKIKYQISNIKNRKIQIYKRRLDNDFAGQRNFGLKKAKYDWVLFLDSDEVLSSKLKKEIFGMKEKPISTKFDGYFIQRVDYFLGKKLKFGETGNISFVRFGNKQKGKWQGRVHEKWEIRGKIGKLQNPILHYPHKSISDFLRKINNYSDIVAQCWKEKGRKVTFFEILLYPFAKFVNNYIFKLGFMDGVRGIIMAIMMSFHSFLVRGKLYLLHKKH